MLLPVAVLVPLTPAGRLSGQADSAAYRPSALFESTEPLSVWLEFDRRTVLRDIDSISRIEHPAVLHLGGADAPPIELQVRTRGHFRRQPRVCRFPPLRLNLKKKQVESTVLEGQDKIKLVTHCQTGREEYEQYVVLEYLVYRILNLLTDHAFRVRLLDLTYVDTTGREDTVRTVGFLLETEEELAARLGGSLFDVGMAAAEIEPDYMTLVDVFQYMVGNTDWSVPGLHNVVLLDAAHQYYAIPFDFDFTGLVHARYARPDGNLPIKDVRERLYRGSCHPPQQFAAAYGLFNDKRDQIYAQFDTPFLTDRTRREVIGYLDDFYDVINNEGVARRQLSDRCR